MYDVFISDRAKKQLQKLDKGVRDQIGAVVERIRIRPFSFVKAIIGSQYYRARAGDYRIILDIKRDKMIILIVEVGHRSKIYKR